MTPWHEGPLACFDLETTGIDPHEARVVTAAIIETGRGVQTRVSEWLLDPGVEIPEAASRIHGITTERAREDGMDAASGVHEIAEHLITLSRSGIPIVGMNVVYDLTLLHAELLRHGNPMAADLRIIAPVVDILVLDKHVDRFRKGKRTLVDLARHYGVALSDTDAHGAAADAMAAGRIAWRIAAQHTEIHSMSLDALHMMQVQWKAEHAASLRDYWSKIGDPRASEVSTDWPVQERAS